MRYSFVGSKSKKVWIFYTYALETKEILAVTMGKRSRKQLQSLMIQLKNLKIEIGFYCTDKFEAFKEVLPYYKHLIGKNSRKILRVLIPLFVLRLQDFIAELPHGRPANFQRN